MLPIIRRRDGGPPAQRSARGCMPSLAVAPAAGWWTNFSARRSASARRAASTCVSRASSLRRRSSSLLMRLRAAAKICLRWRGCSAVPGSSCPAVRPCRAPPAARRQPPRLVALLLDAALEATQFLAIEVVDGGMVRGTNQLELFMAEHGAFGLAPDGQWPSSLLPLRKSAPVSFPIMPESLSSVPSAQTRSGGWESQ